MVKWKGSSFIQIFVEKLLLSQIQAVSYEQIQNGCRLYNRCEENLKVNLDKYTFEVSDKFLSVCIDSNAMQNHWGTLDFTQVPWITLAQGLSPATLRVGGTAQNYAIFTLDDNFRSHNEYPHWPYRDFTVTRSDWDSLNVFVQKAGWDLIFGVNDRPVKNSSSEWDSTNAKKFLQYTLEKNYSITAWALGNEPDRKNARIQVNNYYILDNLLTEMEWPKKSIVGPDSSSVWSGFFARYYLNGNIAKEKDFTSIGYLDRFSNWAKLAKSLTQKYHPMAEIWLDETASTYNGGTYGLSDAYIAGFMWLDKLGLAAIYEHSKVFRQTFYGGAYHLVDYDGYPLPDYWLSYLYKLLVGPRVLKVHHGTRRLRKVRLYAHCINPQNTLYEAGDVVLMAMNLNKCPALISIKNKQFMSGPRHIYWLLPGDDSELKSRSVTLNGELLEMVDDWTLPDILPLEEESSSNLLLPAMSYGFIVFQNAQASACKTE